MRILHTSDWHIGRTFHGVQLLDDQRRALRDLADLVAARSVDTIIVAGDVFDRSVPSADAVRVYDEALARLRAVGARIVVTSGNHDSPTRLGVGSDFAAAGGLFLRTSVSAIDQPVVVSDEYGDVAIYGIPYLEPDSARIHLDVPDARGHADVLRAAMDRVRADLAARGCRSVVVAHAFVSGFSAAGSERSISVGGVETVPSDVFDGPDYVALGHLHAPQTVSDRVRYSGSLLPYSFAERSHRKSVWLVDIDADGLGGATMCPVPGIRGLASLTGTLDELLGDASFEAHVNDYVEAHLTDRDRPVDAMRRLRTRFPFAVHVEWRRPVSTGAIDYAGRVRGRSDADIVRAFLADVRDAPTAGEADIVDLALRAVVDDPESSSVGGELTLFGIESTPDAAGSLSA